MQMKSRLCLLSSVSLGSSHRQAQHHSHRLGAVGRGEVIHCFIISCRNIQRQTSQFISVEPCEDSCSSSSCRSCQRMCLSCSSSTQLQGAAEELEALLLTMVVCLQLDYAHGCFQRPQKIEECRENSSDNCLFVFRNGKE